MGQTGSPVWLLGTLENPSAGFKNIYFRLLPGTLIGINLFNLKKSLMTLLMGGQGDKLVVKAWTCSIRSSRWKITVGNISSNHLASHVYIVARKSVALFCELRSKTRLFVRSSRYNGLSSLATVLQPGVCHYGTKLACCYGWRRGSRGVCEGNCKKSDFSKLMISQGA